MIAAGLLIEFFVNEKLSSVLETEKEISSDLFSNCGNYFLGSIRISEISVDTKTQINQSKQPLKRAAPSFHKSSRKILKNSNVAGMKQDVKNQDPVGFIRQNQASAKLDVTSLVDTLVNPKTNEKLFICSICKYQSALSGNTKRHVETKHMPATVLYPCLTCEKPFKAKADLKKHYINVHKMPDTAAKAMLSA